MSDKEIVFTLRLAEEDWDPGVQAWRCPAFDIPSSYVKEAFADGQRLSANMFKIEKGPARVSWQGGAHPSQIVVIVGLGEKLSPTSTEEWWKRFAIIVPIITALIAAAATYVGKPSCDLKALNDAAANISAAANDVNALTLRVTGNICSGGSNGIPPQAAASIGQQGTAIQTKLRSIATDITKLQNGSNQ
jgi:hypothetical protein